MQNPTENPEKVNDIAEGGYLESFELMMVISGQGKEFNVEIDMDDMTPENFMSIDKITALVKKLMKREI